MHIINTIKIVTVFVSLIVISDVFVSLFQQSYAETGNIQPKEMAESQNQSISDKKSGDDKNSPMSDSKQTFSFNPIGLFHSPYTPMRHPPRQGRLAPDVSAQIEIYEEFQEGLEGIEDFDYIYVLFVFDRSRSWTSKVTPPGATQSRGVFSTRSPNRPCPIGLTVVRLEKREGCFLHVKGIDAFDQTPVLDIKPYINSIDSFPDAGKAVEKKLGLQR